MSRAKADGAGVDPGLPRGTILGADVDLTGGIVADQHNGQAGGEAGGGHLRGDLGAQGGGDGFAVDHSGGHMVSSVTWFRGVR